MAPTSAEILFFFFLPDVVFSRVLSDGARPFRSVAHLKNVVWQKRKSETGHLFSLSLQTASLSIWSRSSARPCTRASAPATRATKATKATRARALCYARLLSWSARRRLRRRRGGRRRRSSGLLALEGRTQHFLPEQTVHVSLVVQG